MFPDTWKSDSTAWILVHCQCFGCWVKNIYKKGLWLKIWASLRLGHPLHREMQKTTAVLLPAGSDFSGTWISQTHRKYLDLSGWWHSVSTENFIEKDNFFFLFFFLNSEKVHLDIYVNLEWKNTLAHVFRTIARRNPQSAWRSPGTLCHSHT